MKSFSIKALALAFIVVAGQAQADITDSVKEFVRAADVKLFGNGRLVNHYKIDGTWYNRITAARANVAIPVDANIDGQFYTKGLPVLRSYLRFENGYARAAVVVAAVAGISAAIVKGYKHFTKPAADATVEGENVEANEATTVA